MFSTKFILVTLSIFAYFIHSTIAYTGAGTWYHVGEGHCGAYSKDSDYIMALSRQEYGDGTHCWKHVRITYQGKSVNAVIADSCEGCGRYDIDLSPAVFDALAPEEDGRIQVDWVYI